MLFRKMLRDMARQKSQFISIFLMSFLGVFIFIGIGSEWYGIQVELDSYYEQSNFGDAWIYGDDFTEKDIKDIKRIKGVSDAELRLSVKAIADFGNEPELSITYKNSERISKSIVVEGMNFSNDTDGIWIDKQFADAKKLHVGDKIKFTFLNTEVEKSISGIVYNPEYVYFTPSTEEMPNHYKSGYGVISADFFLSGTSIKYNEIVIETDRTDFDKLEEEIDEVLDGDYSVFIKKADFTSNKTIVNEVKQHVASGFIFPIVFILVAILTILTTMTRIVNNQRIQIGALKALGFKDSVIERHYISYGFWLSLAGSILGMILGPLLLPPLFYESMAAYYTMMHWTPVVSPLFLLSVVITVAICTFASFSACKTVMHDKPAQMLRPKTPKITKQSFFEKTKLWKHLSFNIQWNLRDVVRSKARSIMAIVGVMGCTALIACAFAMKDTILDISDWSYRKLNNYTTLISVSEKASDPQIDEVLYKFNGESYMQNQVEIKANGKNERSVITITDTDEMLRFTGIRREYITLPEDGLSLSYFTANKLGVKVGDHILWKEYGDDNWQNAKIAAIYRNPVIQGITISRDYYENLGNKYVYKPTSIITDESVSKVYDGMTSTVSNKKALEEFNKSLESFNTMLLVLILAAAVLAIVVLYNLGILYFTEKERDLATLKVVGLKSRKVRELILTQNIWLTVIGIILGFPFGIALVDIIMSFIEMDTEAVIYTPSIIKTIILTFCFSIFVNYMFAGKIKKIDMVAALKGLE